MPTIILEHATKYYRAERRRRELAIRDVDLTVEQGEFVFLLGSSGSRAVGFSSCGSWTLVHRLSTGCTNLVGPRHGISPG